MSERRYHKTFPVSWDELHRNARVLAWRLLDLAPFEGVIAVTRGGMVPAAMLARELDIRLIDTVCVVTYKGEAGGPEDRITEPQVLKSPTAGTPSGGGAGWLLIDDLVDTGTTARVVRELLPQAHFSTIYAKPEGRPLVDTFVTEVSQDTWILFPWDTEQRYAEPVVELR